MPLDILIGLQYGDCGKGKVVDSLSSQYFSVVRFNGGNNAGHSVQFGDTKLKLHSIPSGIAHPEVLNIIGRGCVINPSELMAEIQEVQLALGRPITNTQLLISDRCHIITSEQIELDHSQSQDKIGTTGKGIGPTYSAKHFRSGLRLEDVIDQYPMLAPYMGNAEWAVQQALTAGKDVLAEGAQGTWLDIDHGQYPYVTSSNTLASHACTTLGIGMGQVRDVIGVFKAYTTRVGEGHLEGEWNISGEYGSRFEEIFNNEVGTTTGRSRRCGPLHLPDLKQACFMNGVTKLVITKADLLTNLKFDAIVNKTWGYTKTFGPWEKTALEDPNFSDFIEKIESVTDVEIAAVSNGPDRLDYSYNRLFEDAVV